MNYVQMVLLIGWTLPEGSQWSQRRIIASSFSFEIIQILDYIANVWDPGVGQKPSPFDRTEISVLVSEYLDKLTIPLVYSELFNLLNTVNK